MIQDRSLALEALTRLVSAVNNTGGVLIHPEKNITGCAADPDWLDLADAYCLACGALGEEPKTQPDPQFAMPAVLKEEPGQDFTMPGRKALSELIAKFPAMGPEPEDSCAEDMACPKCGNRGNKRGFRIEFSGLCALRASGSEDDGDHEWDHASKCYCRGCDFSGTVKDFTFPGLDSELLNLALNRAEEIEGKPCPSCKACVTWPYGKPPPAQCPSCRATLEPLAKDKARAAVHYNLPDLLAAMEVDPITPEAQENLGLWIATGCRLFLAIDGAKDARLIHSAYKEFELTKARRHARKLNSCTPRLFRLGFLNNRPQVYKV